MHIYNKKKIRNIQSKVNIIFNGWNKFLPKFHFSNCAYRNFKNQKSMNLFYFGIFIYYN